MMESSGTPSGVVVYEEDNEEDGLDEDEVETAAAAFVEVMGAAQVGMVILEMCAEGGSAEAMLQMESASDTP